MNSFIDSPHSRPLHPHLPLQRPRLGSEVHLRNSGVRGFRSHSEESHRGQLRGFRLIANEQVGISENVIAILTGIRVPGRA
jgi:hypothetical protein